MTCIVGHAAVGAMSYGPDVPLVGRNTVGYDPWPVTNPGDLYDVPTRPRLVTIPGSDTALAAHAHDILAATSPDLPLEAARDLLQRGLQERYPGAVVRPRDDLASMGMENDVVWYVTHRAFRSRIAASLEIPVAPELVFQNYVERFAEWQTAVRLRLRHMTRDLTGSEWAGTWEFLGRRVEGVFRIVEADRPHSVRFEASGMGARVWYDASFTPTAIGTLLRVVGDYDVPDGILPKLADRLFVERSIQRQIDVAHRALVALCLRDEAAPAAS